MRNAVEISCVQDMQCKDYLGLLVFQSVQTCEANGTLWNIPCL